MSTGKTTLTTYCLVSVSEWFATRLHSPVSPDNRFANYFEYSPVDQIADGMCAALNPNGAYFRQYRLFLEEALAVRMPSSSLQGCIPLLSQITDENSPIS